MPLVRTREVSATSDSVASTSRHGTRPVVGLRSRANSAGGTLVLAPTHVFFDRLPARRWRRRPHGGGARCHDGPAPDAMTVRLEDPETHLQHARDVAWKALNRRERTVAELGRLLAAKRVEPSAMETVLAELHEQGYLDDARLASASPTTAGGWTRGARSGSSASCSRSGSPARSSRRRSASRTTRGRWRRRSSCSPAASGPAGAPRATGRSACSSARATSFELAYDALRRHAGVAGEPLD